MNDMQLNQESVLTRKTTAGSSGSSAAPVSLSYVQGGANVALA